MSCERWISQLDAYADGELPPADERALREHLQTCANCASAVLDRVQLKRSVQDAATRFQPDPAFRARMRQAMSPRPARPTRRWMAVLAMSAACVLIFGALWISLSQSHAREQQLLSELVDLHVATLASTSPVDVVSTDRHTVKPWFEGKLPFTFDLPELQGSPFTLVGGRTSYLNQSAGAELIFRVRQHNISLFIFQPAAMGGACRDASDSKLNFHLRQWSRNGLCYALVSDVDGDDLDRLAALLRS